jgi:hypothetical protein
MPSRQISNAAGVWGSTAQAEQVTLEVVNNSAGTLTQGDVVIVDATGTLITTTTTANNKLVIGVVTTTKDASVDATPIAVGAPCQVVVGGVARVQIGAATVAAGDILCSTTTAKAAVTNNAATVGQAFAIALEAQTAKDANNCIRAIIGNL